MPEFLTEIFEDAGQVHHKHFGGMEKERLVDTKELKHLWAIENIPRGYRRAAVVSPFPVWCISKFKLVMSALSVFYIRAQRLCKKYIYIYNSLARSIMTLIKCIRFGMKPRTVRGGEKNDDSSSTDFLTNSTLGILAVAPPKNNQYSGEEIFSCLERGRWALHAVIRGLANRRHNSARAPLEKLHTHLLTEHSTFVLSFLKVDNFPGFPDGVTGPQLMSNMREQGARWGAVFETEDVESVDFSQRPFVVRSASRTVKTQTVIVATGGTLYLMMLLMMLLMGGIAILVLLPIACSSLFLLHLL